MKKIVHLVLMLAAVVFAVNAKAAVRIDLTAANNDPLPIAITPLIGDTEAEKKVSDNITALIESDLQGSGLFKSLPKESFLQTEDSMRTKGPDFQQWRQIKAEAMFTGTATVEGQGDNATVRVEFRLYDVYAEKQIVGRRYTAAVKFWRHISHRIADDIYTSLTGEAGYFTTRIVYIGEQRLSDRTAKKLCVMDQDGGNQQCLTDGGHLVLTPRFSPTAQQVVYMSYASGRPRLYLLDLPTGQQEILGDFPGLNSSPRFSPDGRKIAMTLTQDDDGNPDIYVMDINRRIPKRLTMHSGIDTSPSYSPDGKQIVFNSNRGGKPALYIMDADGNNVRRLTFGEGRYYAPAWSPRGDLIAFVKEIGGRFNIGVIDPDGNEERLLTGSFMDESPSWSPNGRVVIFARQSGDNNYIYSIDLTGHNLRRVPTPTAASDPSWSALLR